MLRGWNVIQKFALILVILLIIFIVVDKRTPDKIQVDDIATIVQTQQCPYGSDMLGCQIWEFFNR